MSAIANYSRSTIRLSIFAGGILTMACILLNAPATQKDAIRNEGAAGVHAPHVRRHHWLQFGKASWYGSPFQGQPTASGEAFDMYQMTCAHRSLPLGALIRVTNLRNHRTVVVRVNDRGPEVDTRIVDLSYGAAKILGFHGMARVRLDLIDAFPSSEEVARLSLPGPSRN